MIDVSTLLVFIASMINYHLGQYAKTKVEHRQHMLIAYACVLILAVIFIKAYSR